MYRRPKFLEALLEIRLQMSRNADYDVDLFSEMIRSGSFSTDENGVDLNGNNAAENTNGKPADLKSES